MEEIPTFKLFSESNPEIIERIQPKLGLRQWKDIDEVEKQRMLERLMIDGFIDSTPPSVTGPIKYLNYKFMLVVPGKHLHDHLTYRDRDPLGEDSAANKDFKEIFVHESQDLVFEMLSVFAKQFINSSGFDYEHAIKTENPEHRAEYIKRVFQRFDRLEKCINNIFKQFGVNMSLTRHGFVPVVDENIQEEIYQPVLQVLSEPKWKPVSADMEDMFNNYNAQKYPEVIAKASNATHRFLQILVGEDGASGKGEFGKLFTVAKERGIITNTRFIQNVITAIKGFIPEERNIKSSSKPSIEEATSSDALLVMHVVMVLLQHCLQNLGEISLRQTDTS